MLPIDVVIIVKQFLLKSAIAAISPLRKCSLECELGIDESSFLLVNRSLIDRDSYCIGKPCFSIQSSSMSCTSSEHRVRLPTSCRGRMCGDGS